MNSIIFLLHRILQSTPSQHCSRHASRLVRQVLSENFYPIFENYGVNISIECPLSKSRDLYYQQEQHKIFEHNARWTCAACGKSFYKQGYIDLHMERKHSDLLLNEEDSPVCLADYCKLFRCEALENRRRSNNHFWSKALCNEEHMSNLKKKCLSLIQLCMPDRKTTEIHKQVYEDIIEETCSLVNCKDYWKPLHYELSSLEVLYYIVFTPIFISVLGIYYHNIWEHYFGDESENPEDETAKRQSSDGEKIPGLRNRFTSSRFEY